MAYPDRGAGNDPKLFFKGGGGGSLSPPRLNIFTVGNMGVMFCLGQGGLRSLSASSLLLPYFSQDENSTTVVPPDAPCPETVQPMATLVAGIMGILIGMYISACLLTLRHRKEVTKYK